MTALARGNTIPVLILVAVLLVVWYIGAVWLNAPVILDRLSREGVTPDFFDLVLRTWTYTRPILPAPHQVAIDLFNSTLTLAPSNKRSLFYHAWITLSATLLGFVLGTVLGILLAVFIVHNAAANRSLMPWIIASQTVPILAVAPVIVVLFFNLLTGQNLIAQALRLNADGAQLASKGVISMYLSFFPVVVGMVKGLRSPDAMQLDLLRTYNASAADVLLKLRLPASLPYLFASLKVGVAASLVGAIVGELPTGAVAGLGARLLSGSYYGQTVQIWAALFAAAIVAAGLVMLIGAVERATLSRMGLER